MSKIKGIIPKQNFEFIKEQIAIIIADEIDNQFVLTSNPDFKVVGYLDRNTPFSHAELPATSVTFDDSNWTNEHLGSATGMYLFSIDSIYKAKTTDAERGDRLAKMKSDRLAGMIAYILRDPIYKTLGFPPGFIGNVSVNRIVGGMPAKEPDAENVSISRVFILVKAQESNELLEPTVLEEFLTEVRIENTDKGYRYLGVNYPI